MRLATDAVISTLALLLVLGGALWLPRVGANTADMNVALTVLGEGGGGDGGGGSGSPQLPSSRPSPPVVTPVVPLPEQPKPTKEFKLVDYAPKIIPVHRDTPIALYGYNFPSDFKIVVKAKDAILVADSAAVDKKTTVIEGAVLETVQYVVPAKTLSPGEAILLIQKADQVLTLPLPILVYDPAKAISLRAQIAQRTINVTVVSGQPTNIAVKFKNIGLTEWDYLLQPLHIGTDRPRDRQSRFVHKDWPYNNRAIRVVLPKGIKTGEVFDVTFPIQAPVVKRTTRYTENFALVAEGLSWIPGSGFSIRVTVSPVANQVITDGKLTTSSNLSTKDDKLTAPAKSSTIKNDGAVPIGGKLALAPEPSSAATKSPSPYKMPNEVASASRWTSVETVLNSWFVKPIASLFVAIGKLW
ncbi:MAG: hypothetical protein V1826_02425 [bacterium]